MYYHRVTVHEVGERGNRGRGKENLGAAFREADPGGHRLRSRHFAFAGPGAIVKEGSGSRVKIFISGKVIQFHKPHQKELPRYVVEDIRDALAELGVCPQ